MSLKATIDRLRAAGVPDAAIPSVLELIEEREAEARRPKTSTERSREHRAKPCNEIVAETSPERCASVATASQPCPETAANTPEIEAPRVRVLYGEEVKYTPKETSFPIPQAEKPAEPVIDAKRVGRKQSLRGCRLPEGWTPSDDARKFAVETLGSGRAAHAELAKFCDHWHAAAGQTARKLDWDAAWRNWCRKAAERSSPARGPPGNRPMSRAEILMKIANPEPTFDQPEFDIELTATHVEA